MSSVSLITPKAKAIVPACTTRTYPSGQVCLDAQAGDVVLVRHKGFVAKGIRLMERARTPAPFCWANHAAVVLSSGPNATLVQETPKGSVVTFLADLLVEDYTVSHFTPEPAQLAAGLEFLKVTLGTGYGYLTIPADLFNALTGLEVGFGWGGRMVCSTQTCRFMERIGLVPDRSPYAVTPAHLAWYLNVIVQTEG